MSGRLPAPEELTALLHRDIPLAAAAGVRVEACDGASIRLSAPLAPNSNLHGTAFAGSQSLLGILAGWTLLHACLRQAGRDAELVIRDSRFSYRRPVTGDFWAEASLTAAETATFLADLTQGGRARLTLTANVGDASGACGRHEGLFVALAGKNP